MSVYTPLEETGPPYVRQTFVIVVQTRDKWLRIPINLMIDWLIDWLVQTVDSCPIYASCRQGCNKMHGGHLFLYAADQLACLYAALPRDANAKKNTQACRQLCATSNNFIGYFYARQHVMLSASLLRQRRPSVRLSDCLSVRPSVRHTAVLCQNDAT